jgi:hypothetical protein
MVYYILCCNDVLLIVFIVFRCLLFYVYIYYFINVVHSTSTAKGSISKKHNRYLLGLLTILYFLLFFLSMNCTQMCYSHTK